MAYDQLKIYNNALTTYIGEGKLSSLTEARGPRYLLDAVWAEDPVRYCLEQGQWQFATKTIKIEADSGLEPDFGYRYAFPKPDDWVRTVAMSSDEYFTEPWNSFVDEAGYWYSSIDTLYIKHVSDANDYGRDYALWSPSFYEYVSCFHAWKIVNRIQNSRMTRKELTEELEKILNNAQGKDGVNRPTSFLQRGSWNRARHRGNSSYNRERR